MIDFSRPGLAVFDMDSTLIEIECIDEIAALAGCKSQVSAITTAAMRGELDFASSLQQRVALLKGVDEALLASLFSPVPLTQGAAELIQWLRGHGWKTAVVSGGFTWFAEQLKPLLQLDAVVANRLDIEHGRLTGRLIPPIIDARSKADQLLRWCQQWGISPHNTLAVGDGANDIPLVQTAAYGVAFCAKEALRAHAQLAIDSPDLMGIARYFEAQGFAWPK